MFLFRAEEFEEILDAHERYRAEEEKLFEVTHEEVLHLRQKEVLGESWISLKKEQCMNNKQIK